MDSMMKYMVRSVLWLLRPEYKRPELQQKKVCSHCPYRKDKANWMDESRTFLNVALIHHKRQQSCHMAHDRGRIVGCKGALVCMEGGSDIVVSPSELGMRTPVALEDMVKAYKGEL